MSGWWFVRNKQLYGQFLATKASENYLQSFYLHPIPWSFHIVFETLPQTLLTNTWYTQPDEYLPLSMNRALLDIALVLPSRRWLLHLQVTHETLASTPDTVGLALLGSIVAGIAAVVITIQASSTVTPVWRLSD